MATLKTVVGRLVTKLHAEVAVGFKVSVVHAIQPRDRTLIAARERRHRRMNGVPVAMSGRRADLINGGTPTGMEAAVFRKHACNLPLKKALN